MLRESFRRDTKPKRQGKKGEKKKTPSERGQNKQKIKKASVKGRKYR